MKGLEKSDKNKASQTRIGTPESTRRKIKELAGKRNKIEKKWKKAENIRKNIKEMGTEVSKNMLAHISEGATINFHKITGRSEKSAGATKIMTNIKSIYREQIRKSNIIYCQEENRFPLPLLFGEAWLNILVIQDL